MKTSFLAKTSISATGYNINIGVKIDSIINLSIFKFLKKLNNKMKYVNTSKICIINIESLKFVLRK